MTLIFQVGPDRFTGSFYHHCWETFIQIFVWLFKNFPGWVLFKVISILTWILSFRKLEGASSISQFHPVRSYLPDFQRLLISVYPPPKWLLLKTATSLIRIAATSECVNLLNSESYGGNFAEAIDTIEWSFSLRVLTDFGFNELFLGWVKDIIKSALIFHF